MKTWLFAGVGLALAAGGVAIAQTPPAPPPPSPPGPGEAAPPHPGPERGMHGRPGGWMGMHGHRPPPPMKAAVFRFRKGDQSVFIKCADDEPTKACVDAAAVLLDKLGK